MNTNETITASVRLPKELLDWVDSYSRIEAVNRRTRVTRSEIIVGFLETMKAVVEYREKNEWGHSHLDEITKVFEANEQRHAA
jgi:metal-responsive CopG/Arc/MetJ family transcriptional regulator